jgi:hypothetical protein
VATQLRSYRIADGAIDQFVSEWRSQLAPLREAIGFTIDGAWTVVGESRFVWLLSHAGSWDDFAAADRRYFDSPERARVDPDPARLIAQQTNVRLSAVER